MPDLRVPPLAFDPARAARTLEGAGRTRLSPPDAKRARCWMGCSATAPFWAGWRCAKPDALGEYFAAGPEDGAERRDPAGAGGVALPTTKPRR